MLCPWQVYTAGIENVVKVWDLRKEEVVMSLKGHNDTVTGMVVSPDGTHLLTNAMDNTLRVGLLDHNPAAQCPHRNATVFQERRGLCSASSMCAVAQVWDMRPYAPANRCTKVFTGHQHNFEKNLLRCAWSADGSQVRRSA